MLLYGSSFSLEMRRPIESNSANEMIKVIAAIVKSTTMAYVGNTRGSIKAGNIGTTPMITPNGWFAPIGVL